MSSIDRARLLYERALAAEDVGDGELALRNCEASLEANPGHLPAVEMLLRLCDRREGLEQRQFVERLYRTLLEQVEDKADESGQLSSSLVRVGLYRTRRAVFLGRIELALSLLASLRERAHAHVDVLDAERNLLVRLQRFEDAIEACSRFASRARSGSDAWVHALLAGARIALELLDAPDKASELLAEVLRVHPQAPVAMFLLAQSKLRSGAIEGARALLEEMLDEDAATESAFPDDPDDASLDLGQPTPLDGVRRGDVLACLGRVYETLGDADLAARCYQQALSSRCDHRTAALALVRNRWKHGAWDGLDEALALTKSKLGQSGKSIGLLLRLEAAALRERAPERAEDALRRVIERPRAGADPYLELADLVQMRGGSQAALSVILEGLHRLPTSRDLLLRGHHLCIELEEEAIRARIETAAEVVGLELEGPSLPREGEAPAATPALPARVTVEWLRQHVTPAELDGAFAQALSQERAPLQQLALAALQTQAHRGRHLPDALGERLLEVARASLGRFEVGADLQLQASGPLSQGLRLVPGEPLVVELFVASDLPEDEAEMVVGLLAARAGAIITLGLEPIESLAAVEIAWWLASQGLFAHVDASRRALEVMRLGAAMVGDRVALLVAGVRAALCHVLALQLGQPPLLRGGKELRDAVRQSPRARALLGFYLSGARAEAALVNHTKSARTAADVSLSM